MMERKWSGLVVAFLGLLGCLQPLAANAGLSFNTVIIDAGHGGKDGGCVWNGLIEKNLCLDVAKRLEKSLKARGMRTVMIRSSDVFVELEGRAEKANRYKRSVFVSLHFNASRDRSIAGMEILYRSARGKTLARSILRSMDKRLTVQNRGLIDGNFKVLRGTLMPAVIVEGGYLSNKAEAKRCATAAHRQTMAEAIASGIMAVRD